MSAQLDVQKMIYEALDSGLQGTPVFDHVPQDFEQFPFVVVGDDIYTELSTDLKPGFDVTATVHSYSRYAGSAELKDLQGDIYDILNRQPLDVDGGRYGVAGITFDYSDVSLEGDGLTRHGVQRFILYLAEI